jgi:hypothetical protein
MLFNDTVYIQTGIFFKGHTNGTCGEGEIRINMKHSMDMLFVSPLSLGVRCSHIMVHRCVSRDAYFIYMERNFVHFFIV